MIKSMTGFGRGEGRGKYGTIVVEIRTLNHRFFEPLLRLPNHFSFFEGRIKEYLQKKIKRGRINLSLTYERKGSEDTVSVDKVLVRKYHKIVCELKEELGLKGEIEIGELLTLFPGMIIHQETEVKIEKIWGAVSKALSSALEAALKMRIAEGKSLYKDFVKRTDLISGNVAQIKKRLPVVVRGYKRKLTLRVKELKSLPGFNRGRLEEEVAIFAKNCDVTEEITRLAAHLNNFRKALDKKEEVGRELDFIAQELYREINTVGSKANDFTISRWVIKVKSEIEKIREQVQNIE